MAVNPRKQQKYDHRLRELVQATGDIRLAIQRGVPKSTAHGWLTRTSADVVTLDVVDMSMSQMQQELMSLRRRNERLISLLRLIVTVLKVTEFSLSNVRIPEGYAKRRLLQSIEQSRAHFSLRTVLRVIGLTHGRFHSWNQKECQLTDSQSCPKSSPQQLTLAEVAAIREMVTSGGCRHVPTGTLARLAQRRGKVFASPSTWYRLIRLNQWRRSRQRIHPAKPKVGIRASKVNEIWHVDTSLFRLISGGRAYLHAVIDNYSRRILSWHVSDSFQPGITAKLLVEAQTTREPRKRQCWSMAASRTTTQTLTTLLSQIG